MTSNRSYVMPLRSFICSFFTADGPAECPQLHHAAVLDGADALFLHAHVRRYAGEVLPFEIELVKHLPALVIELVIYAPEAHDAFLIRVIDLGGSKLVIPVVQHFHVPMCCGPQYVQPFVLGHPEQKTTRVWIRLGSEATLLHLQPKHGYGFLENILRVAGRATVPHHILPHGRIM